MDKFFYNYNKLISEMYKIHEDICFKWENFCNENNISIFNQKKREVSDILKDENISQAIYSYQEFLLDKSSNISSQLKECGASKCRVKARNSIEDKIARYIHSAEKGASPIKKCLNDIFGVRILTDREYTTTEIEKIIYENCGYGKEELRVINSNKPNQSYLGTHIYFHKDNFNYDWELQIWYRAYAQSNEASHKEYKQGYTMWEELLKGETK